MRKSLKCSDVDLDAMEEISADDLLKLLGEEPTNENKIVDYDNRIINIFKEIDEKSINNYILPIVTFNREDDGLEIEDRQPIIIQIASNGGDVNVALSLIDVMLASHTPIITVNLCNAYSSGFLIGLAGHRRFAYKHSMFLLHDGYMGMQNSGSKFKDVYKFLMSREEAVKRYIAERTNISKSVINKNYHKEWFITADEALKLGIIDRVIDNIIY